MPYKIVTRSLFITANYFNVSVLRESWLLKEGVLEDGDIDSSRSIFSPNLVNISNNKFNFLCRPSDLQIYLLENSEINEFNKIKKLIQNLSHIPYKEIGLAVSFLIEDFDTKLSKTLFDNPSKDFYKEFTNDDNANFGAYFSKEFLGFRFKMDIKPVNINENQTDKAYLKIDCVLGQIIDESKINDSLESLLENASHFFEYSNVLVSKLN